MKALYTSEVKGAPNFTYWELFRSDTALRKGITNIPTQTNVKALEFTAQTALQPIREQFGAIRITSGYRSPELCIAIGSSKNSNHARGEAADFEPINSAISLLDVGRWISENIQFRELIFEYLPDGWLHIACRKDANINKIKLKDKDHNYKHVDIEYIEKIYRKS